MKKRTGKPRPSLEFVEPDEGLFMTYSNSLEIGFTPSDLRIVFGEIIDSREGQATIEQRAQVTLAWMQAKVLRHMLDEAIRSYEKANGEIRVPPELLELASR